MKFLNGILGVTLLFLFACEPDEPAVAPQDNVSQNGNGSTNLNAGNSVSTSAQDVLQIGSKMKELESFGFGRPSILSSGFGFAERGRSLANGRVREDSTASDDDDSEWHLDEETLALLEEIGAMEQELDSLEAQLNITEDEQQIIALEEAIETLEDEIDELEEALEEKIGDFDDEDWEDEFYIEDCEYTNCAQEEFTENEDGSSTWVLDYGDGCQEHDGITLTGKITETFMENGNEFSGTIIYENFGEGDYSISGTETFRGTIENDEDSLDFSGSYSFSESLQITADDETFTVNSSGTETFDANGFTEEGTWSYETSKGDFAESKITTPLFFSIECEDQDVFEFVSGVEETTYQEEGEPGTFKIDYGLGTCDNIITLTENGETMEIDLDDEEWEEDEDEDEISDGGDD